MKAVKAKILKNNQTFNLNEASSFIDRLIGLMGKRSYSKDGLLIKNSKSIHSCFMFFPIDVVFVDKRNITIKIIKNFKPWRMTSVYFKAESVLEFKTEILPDSLSIGDKWEFEYV
jgi:uncharacterized membrane protein (UPF0127 family)